jgi:hypothetical protein
LPDSSTEGRLVGTSRLGKALKELLGTPLGIEVRKLLGYSTDGVLLGYSLGIPLDTELSKLIGNSLGSSDSNLLGVSVWLEITGLLDGSNEGKELSCPFVIAVGDSLGLLLADVVGSTLQRSKDGNADCSTTGISVAVADGNMLSATVGASEPAMMLVWLELRVGCSDGTVDDDSVGTIFDCLLRSFVGEKFGLEVVGDWLGIVSALDSSASSEGLLDGGKVGAGVVGSAVGPAAQLGTTEV